MPRITKADLTASLETSRRQVESLEFYAENLKVRADNLQENVESLMSDLSMEQASSKSWMARVVLLEKENKALKAERGQGARSRSPRRDAVSAATTHRVLKLVQHFERDNVIDEQRETIAKQQREIVSLRRGDGPIGEVLMHNWRQGPGAVADYTVNMLKAQTTPVNTALDSLRRLISASYDISFWGGMSPHQVTALSPVMRIYP